MKSNHISALSVPTGQFVIDRSSFGLRRIVISLFISVVLSGLAAAQTTGCPLNSPGGNISHIVYIQFDNLELERQNPNVPSDLEQMPNLYNFLKNNGTLFANHHTPLISHTADDILTSLTGVYPDRHGQAVANSFVAANHSGTYWDIFPSSFTYWTNQVSTNSAQDTSFSMITDQGQNMPAPWVPFTRLGCNVGAVSIANMELENNTSDITNVFGANSNESKESSSQKTADFVGIAIHCAQGTACASFANNKPDLLPGEPGGYTGYTALFGHKYAVPYIAPSGLNDLDGNPITGFPGFGGISPSQALAYVATMLENNVPIVYSYISDAHDCHSSTTCTPAFRAFGPGEAGYVSQLQTYDNSFGQFFTRLANDGINTSNTLFIVSSDEQDHFVGGPAAPSNCDGVTTPCTYTYSGGGSSIGEVEADLAQLYQQQFPNLIPNAKTATNGLFSTAILDYHFDMAPAVYLNPNNPSNTPSFARQMERAAAQLTALNPITNTTDTLSHYLIDSAGMGALHMITNDPLRTPTFVMFAHPDWYFQNQTPLVQQYAGYAWNHGGAEPEIYTTWVGMAGPGVQTKGTENVTWSDHTDIRPTMLYLAGVTDDYTSDGRVLVEDLNQGALNTSLQSNLSAFEQLAAAYKQMTAPVGSFGLATLQASTTALSSGSTSSDSLYTTFENNLTQLTAQRNTVASQIKTQLNAVEFQGATLNSTTANTLTTVANGLSAEAQSLVTNLNATPLAPNSIQVSRIQYDGVNSDLGNGDTYTSPYLFPEIFNDQAGCSTGNKICNIAGIEGSIFIDQFGSVPGSPEAPNAPLALPPTGASVTTYPTPEPGAYITTSFTSKSEGALMLSPNGNYLTYMGYQGPDTVVNVSNGYSLEPLNELSPNSYTDSNGTPYPFYDREVALIGASGLLSLTPIDNANSGDNPRAAITLDGNQLYTAGNADSTEKPVTIGGVTYNEPGLTIGVRCAIPQNSQSYQLGTYTAADRGDETTKQHVKDNNWRGIGIYTDANGKQQLYVSKGSGGNGDDGLFQVGSPVPSCTSGGTDTNNTISELPGLAFPVTNQSTGAATPILPFGFWFANPTTVYIADEGNPPSYTGGSNPSFSNSTNGTYVPSNDSYAGLEKWSLVNGTWTLDYTIQAGLNFNQPQTFPGYNDVDGNPIQSYTYGLRNMTGYNNGDGTVTLYAITAQFSAASGGEPDPTSLVGITDSLAATTLPANEQFVTLQTSAPQKVFRGVAYVPPASGFTRAAQTVTFNTPATATYGDAPITLSATSTSGWPIAYTLTSGPATISGNTLTITGAGSIVVQAAQSGNTDYAPGSATQTITVNPAQLLVTPTNASSIYGGSIPSLSASITGFVNGDSSSVVTGAPALSTTATSASGAGDYPITASAGTLSAANYTFTFGMGTLTISPALLTVTPNNATTTYGTIPSFTASYTGFVNGDNSGVLSGSPALSTTATTTSDVGTYPITATQGTLTAANYTFGFGSGTLTINQASQTISFSTNAPSTDTYNSSFTVTASATSGLAVTYSSSGSCSNSGATYTITSGTGTCSVTASQSGNTNYLAASPVNESTTAQRANATVTFTGAPALAPYNSTFQLTATTNASGTAFITATNPSVCSLSGNYSPATVTMLQSSGKCVFTATWGADANYNPASATQSTVGEKAASVITWANPAAITYGTALSNTQLNATANVAGTFTYSPASGKVENVGNDTLKVTFKPTNTNYASSTATVSLQVVQAATTTTITSPSTTVTLGTTGTVNVVLNFNVTSYKPAGAVTLTATTGEVCSGSLTPTTGNGSCKLTFTSTGTRTITASYSGDANHTGSNSSGQTPAVTVTVNAH